MDTDDTKLTMTVVEAGKKLGIGRQLAYDLAARGQLPTLRLGRRLVVPTLALERMLEAASRETAAR